MATTDSPLINAVRQLFDRQADQLPELREPIKAFLAGGVAVHYWIGIRVTSDVDAEFSLAGTGYRNFLPIDDVMAYVDQDGQTRAVHIDRTYSPVFALMHEDYVVRAHRLGDKLGGKGKLEVYVLAPEDLAISKMARWSPHDQEDVIALADQGWLDADELELLAFEAANTAVGHNPNMLRINILEAINYVRAHQPPRPRI
ncbi:DUF6036 family nucleotidyltransferase [Xanthomonas citri]|uniref:DUF6036 family nucleotidyltransferase n=1 Tax=Xanthomonas citri TaxID=346 RepID=UPI000CCF43CD|nr:DUF6036 family nucleotidyltransferase [Xanthomonas citri]PNV26812.1 hypothetical protein xavtCFBP7764_21650 [Xanthomonas citri]